jgi:hypothetical protein
VLAASNYFSNIDFSRNQEESLKVEELNEAMEQLSSQVSVDKVSLRDAEVFMQSRCNTLNQQLLESKTAFFDGIKTYVFLSIASNGYHCISMVSTVKLEVLAADCGPMQTKMAEWQSLN